MGIFPVCSFCICEYRRSIRVRHFAWQWWPRVVVGFLDNSGKRDAQALVLGLCSSSWRRLHLACNDARVAVGGGMDTLKRRNAGPMKNPDAPSPPRPVLPLAQLFVGELGASSSGAGPSIDGAACHEQGTSGKERSTTSEGSEEETESGNDTKSTLQRNEPRNEARYEQDTGCHSCPVA